MSRRKIMITGGNGMLGRQLQSEFSTTDEIIIADINNTDITNLDKFNSFVSEQKPDVIIHAAAYTQVDKAETEVDLAYKINAIGSKNVAIASTEHKAKLVAISTDYVFHGDSVTPYNEYDIPNPVSVYGKSKYAGEEYIKRYSDDYIIARISWLYGFKGPSFIHTMRRLSTEGRAELKVVSDQIGNPTSTIAVSRGLRELLKHKDLQGIFHLTCEGEATWYELATKFFQLMGITQRVVSCTSDEYKTLAKRPSNSRLDKLNLRLNNLPPMPNWVDALEEFIKLEKF